MTQLTIFGAAIFTLIVSIGSAFAFNWHLNNALRDAYKQIERLHTRLQDPEMMAVNDRQLAAERVVAETTQQFRTPVIEDVIPVPEPIISQNTAAMSQLEDLI